MKKPFLANHCVLEQVHKKELKETQKEDIQKLLESKLECFAEVKVVCLRRDEDLLVISIPELKADLDKILAPKEKEESGTLRFVQSTLKNELNNIFFFAEKDRKIRELIKELEALQAS